MTCGFFIVSLPCIPKILKETGAGSRIKRSLGLSSGGNTSKRQWETEGTGPISNDGRFSGSTASKAYYRLDPLKTSESTEYLRKGSHDVGISRTTQISVTHEGDGDDGGRYVSLSGKETQGSSVKKVCIFQENMPFDEWDLTMRSKGQTSWTLHTFLPQNLQLSVLLSCLAGVVGQMASSNYSGGCAFQDALARHRVALGERAVSIDIGWMRNIGIIAETGAYQRQREVLNDMTPIDSNELLALLTMCCNPNAPQRLPDNSQVLFGLRTPADFLIEGKTPTTHFGRSLLASFSYTPDSGTSPGEDIHRQNYFSPGTLFRKSTDSTERIQIGLRALAAKLAGAMSISTEDVEPNKPLSTYGVDSLMAVDLRNWIGKEFGATVAVFDIMGSGVPLASIADLVVARSTFQSI